MLAAAVLLLTVARWLRPPYPALLAMAGAAVAIAPAFLLSLFGSVIGGLVLAWVVGQVTRRIEDAPSSIIVQFVRTYGVWVLAERAGLSPILTMVSYAMTLARSAPAYCRLGSKVWPALSSRPALAVRLLC